MALLAGWLCEYKKCSCRLQNILCRTAILLRGEGCFIRGVSLCVSRVFAVYLPRTVSFCGLKFGYVLGIVLDMFLRTASLLEALIWVFCWYCLWIHLKRRLLYQTCKFGYMPCIVLDMLSTGAVFQSTNSGIFRVFFWYVTQDSYNVFIGSNLGVFRVFFGCIMQSTSFTRGALASSDVSRCLKDILPTAGHKNLFFRGSNSGIFHLFLRILSGV